jgi:ribose transport system ATP-binding protein
MVGRKLGQEYPTRERKCGDVMLSLENISTEFVKDISFEVHEGEIFGIAGLVGSGRTEIANAIFGVDKIQSGKMMIKDKEVKVSNPSEAMRLKIGLHSEERKKMGIWAKCPFGRISLSASCSSFPGGSFQQP